MRYRATWSQWEGDGPGNSFGEGATQCRAPAEAKGEPAAKSTWEFNQHLKNKGKSKSPNPAMQRSRKTPHSVFQRMLCAAGSGDDGGKHKVIREKANPVRH